MNSTSNLAPSIQDFLVSENKADLIAEIYQGLTKRQKQISSRFFYNDRGSELFEEITKLPEYYPTRTEKQILQKNASAIVGKFEQLEIIELGSGDCSKISILLDTIPKDKISHVNYIPVDVSEAAILKSTDMLSCKYPELKIHGLLADFMKHLDSLPGNSHRLICFFGSTLGNLTRKQANEFLLNLKNFMKPGDSLLLGLDRVKKTEILHKAYNDNQGVTAKFNKNILNVLNEITGTNFDTSDFEHLAFYNQKENRIEMHLKALNTVVVNSNFFPNPISTLKGETIHTENSHKFTMLDIEEFAKLTGFKVENTYSDRRKWFTLAQFTCFD